MIQDMTAYERDELWLAAQGHAGIAADIFCDWVCRCVSDGLPENKAREYVLEQLLKNK